MNKLVNELLNDLIDKYENSVISKGGSNKELKIKFTTKNSILKLYSDPESYKYVDDNDEAVLVVEKLGFIAVVRKDDGSFASLTLNLDRVGDVYKYLGRPSRDEQNQKIVDLLNSYDWKGPFAKFKQSQIDYIRGNYTFSRKYFDSLEQLRDVCDALDGISLLENDIKERDFSMKVFGDSKRFSSIRSRVSSILRQYSDEEYSDDDDVLADYHVIKNSTYVLVKGKMVFKLRNQVIDLLKLGFEYSLSDDMIRDIELLDCSFSKVITVENLTTFYGFNEEDSLIIYLAGFHNHTKQNLLKKIYSTNKTAAYYHFGDIDAGGIHIFNNLKRKTGIPFEPFYMNYASASSRLKYLKPLTLNDRHRLELLLTNQGCSEFEETIKWMLNNGLKLEQEAFDL